MCCGSEFEFCPACGKRGHYCFAEPLHPKTAAGLEALLETIEAHPSDTFKTDIWRIASSKYTWYGTARRMLEWLAYVGVIECVKRSRGGNVWAKVDAR